MRVSAKAEYACVAMIELAINYLSPMPIRMKAIADAQNIPQRFLVQILLQLKTAGLVSSVRGASGGYQLAKAPERITLAAVIAAIDERSLTVGSALGDTRAPAGRALLSVWREVHLAEQRVLEDVTLADLVHRSRETGFDTYQI